jgi:hypothetical protein
MISEKQKLLCMKFADGVLVQAHPPAWFEAHLRTIDTEPDWQGSLLKAGGLRSWETIGGSETYEIYKTEEGGFFIDYTDVFESAAWIFIDKPADYITFRATVLAAGGAFDAHRCVSQGGNPAFWSPMTFP